VKVVSASGTTSTKTVTLGVVGDTGTEIKTGLKVGQTVVIGTVAPTTETTGTGTGTRGTQGGIGGAPAGGFPTGGFPGGNN